MGSALLLDGNIGIGGAPDALLARLPAGEVLVELASASGRDEVRADPPRGRRTPQPLVRAYVRNRRDLNDRAASFVVAERWQDEQRWFARLIALR